MKSIVNRKARFEYQFLQLYDTGIILTGTEVKSIRAGNANINDAYCYFSNSELFIKDMFVAEYKQAGQDNHEPKRERKLLLKKNELRKLERKNSEKGLTIIPYKIFVSDRGFIKVQIALAQGKKSFDKRQTIKERETQRDLDRILKSY